MIAKAYAGDVAASAVAATSGTASVVTAIAGIVEPILGVPLPVVLAAIAGAALARAFRPAIGFFRAVGRVTGWVVLGCALAPTAKAVAVKLLGADLPTNAMAGMAAIVAAAEAWPMLLAYLRAEVPWVARLLGEKKGDGQ